MVGHVPFLPGGGDFPLPWTMLAVQQIEAELGGQFLWNHVDAYHA